MASDLSEHLQMHANLLVAFSRYIVGKISEDDLTIDQAQRAYEAVERVYRSFNDIAEETRMHLLEGPLLEAVAQIEKAWISLFDVTATRLRALQGLPPIDDSINRRKDA